MRAACSTRVILNFVHPLPLSKRAEMLQPAAVHSDEARLKLADILIKLMRLDEAEALLARRWEAARAAQVASLRYEIHKLRGEAEDYQAAATIAAQLAENSIDDVERNRYQLRRANALALSNDYGTGDFEKAREIAFGLIEQAAPHLQAISPLIRMGLTQEDAEKLLSACEEWQANGKLASPRLIAGRQALLALLGRTEEARLASGYDRFFQHSKLAIPPRWSSSEEFNAALEQEIKASPDLFYSGKKRPGRDLWRLEGLPRENMPAIASLVEAIASKVESYAASFGLEDDHQFLQHRPQRAKFNAWAAIASASGHEEWHIHPKAWLSGVYYVAMPAARASGNAGAIEFGWPGGKDKASAEQGTVIASIHPSPGDLLLFPSTQYHKSIAPQVDGERIAIAFDIMPLPDA